jgi:hypothetical protein
MTRKGSQVRVLYGPPRKSSSEVVNHPRIDRQLMPLAVNERGQEDFVPDLKALAELRP